MKNPLIGILFAIVLAAAARADTALTIPALYNCYTDFGSIVALPSPPTLISAFSLNSTSGQGSFQSQVPSYWDEKIPPNQNDAKFDIFSYSIDLSGVSASTSHCVKLIIHFGTPGGCFNPGVQGSPTQIQSATLGPFGDITFVFNNGCLQPGQPAISFSMVGVNGFKTNSVTVIDDYVDPASGMTNEVRINVPAIVPDVPPDPPPWVIAYYYSRVNPVLFQGAMDLVGTNQTGGTLIPTNGNYDLLLQLLEFPTNGPVISQVVTQRVPVLNGLFTVPLPGDPVAYHSPATRYLSVGVRPAGGSGGFSQVNPPLPITPAPQALYAFSAGSVADLAPGQAVTSLNGLTDAVNLQAGSGIVLGTNGNTITISTLPGTPSDRSIKTDFAPVSAEKILARVAALPISSWRYTNETAGVRHVGPMAQDFRATFGLGHDDKFIEFVDEEGVALTAIQGLNQKLDERNARIDQLEQSVAELKQLVLQLTKTNSPRENGH